MRNLVIWWWWWFCVLSVVVAMPHFNEPGHFSAEEENTNFGHHDDNDDDNGAATGHQPTAPESNPTFPSDMSLMNPVVMSNGTHINSNPTMEDTAAVMSALEGPTTASSSQTTSENDPASNIPTTATTNNDNDGDGGALSTNSTEGEESTKTSTLMELLPNEISRSLSSSSSPPLPATTVAGKEEDEAAKHQQEVGNVVEDEFPMNSITPTIPAVSSLPRLPPPPPPPPPPVIDPISFYKSDDGDKIDDGEDRAKATSSSSASNDNGVSSTSTTYLQSLPKTGASRPSIQLIAPPPHQPSSSPDNVPREPDQGELPESPAPSTPQHPYNLQDIPISLLSLSGNSGGSTNDMATFSSLVSPTDNVPVDFTRFRYHVVTGQLFKIGSNGPGICPENMRFFAVPGHPKNGACDCDYYQCSRPLIYSPEKHQCYWAWSQGPCENEEWFVFDKDLRRRGTCEKNPCPSASFSNSKNSSTSSSPYNPTNPSPTSASLSDYIFQSSEDNACYQAGTQGYCGDADERLLIFPGEPIPKCRKFTLCYPLTVPQELQCIYGNKYFVESGHCQ